MNQKKLFAYAIYIIMCLLPLSAMGARQPRRTFFDKYNGIPTRKLMLDGYKAIAAGHSDSALIYYNVVYNRYVLDPDDRKKAQSASMALNNMGYIMMMQFFDYEKAFNYLMASKDLSYKLKDDSNLPYVYVNLGNLALTERAYFSPGDYKDAISYYKKGFYIGAKHKDWDIMLTNFSNLISIVTSDNRIYDINHFKKEVDYFHRLQIPDTVPMLAYVRKEVELYTALSRKKFPEALRLIGEARPLIDKNNIDRMRYDGNLSVVEAQCMAFIHRYDEALDLLQRSISKVSSQGILDLKSDFYQAMANIAQLKGDSTLSEHYGYLYLRQMNELLFSHKLANVEGQRFLYDLNKANEELAQQARNHRVMTMILWIFATLLIVIIILSVILYRNNRQLKESNHQLYLQFRQSLESQEHSSIGNEQKYKNSTLDDAQRERIIELVKNVMQDNSQICDESMSLHKLSELIDTPYKLVSQVINEHWQKNFSQLLADYRVREACRRMQDREQYGNYTIEAIGTTVGFHTRSNFVTTFKRITGLTPSEYMREVKGN